MKRLLVILVVGVVGCSSDAPKESRAADNVATPDEAVGRDCEGPAVADFHDRGTCPANHMCVAGTCECMPGFTACGTRCVDLSKDGQNCGRCGHSCGHSCARGACDDEPPLPDPEIDGSVAATQCLTNGEAYPELSATYSATGAAMFVAFEGSPYDDFSYNWANQSYAWQPESPELHVPGNFYAIADQWATTSGYSGLDYVAQVVSTATQYCIGIGAASPGNLPNPNNWEGPVACSVPGGQWIPDGPSIHFDLGSTALYTIDHRESGSVFLNVFGNCQSGAPGTAGCPRTVADKCVRGACAGDADILDHADVTVNPCTHDAVVAFRVNNQIRIAFYNRNGVFQNNFIVDSNAPYANVCAGGGTGMVPTCCGGCARIASRVQVATAYTPNRFGGQGPGCYAYVAYDSSCTSGGGNHMRAHFDIVDITQESNVFIPTACPNGQCLYTSSACDGVNTDNDFGSISTANAFTSNVGWFYYHQPSANACTTTYKGRGDTTMGSQMATIFQTGSFPSVLFSNDSFAGLGDYWGIIKRGLPGGSLYPTWTQPIPMTSGTCVSCLGSQWSMAVMGQQVTP